jgi:hypothetical protein
MVTQGSKSWFTNDGLDESHARSDFTLTFRNTSRSGTFSMFDLPSMKVRTTRRERLGVEGVTFPALRRTFATLMQGKGPKNAQTNFGIPIYR